MKITERFAELDENLKLDPTERKQAQELHQEISDVLIEAGIAKRCRLQGSFARKTMRPPLHDVDKVVELVDALRTEFSGLNGPGQAMERIRGVLVHHFPGADFEVKKHSLGIELPGYEFDFDAVPAFTVPESTLIEIANTQAGIGEDAWRTSNTYDLIDVVSARNIACGGRLVRQVRMVKQVFHEAGLSESVPGLHVESFTYWAVAEATDHAAAVAASLAKAVDLLGGTYTDPTGVDAISSRIEPWTVQAVRPQVQSLAAQAAQALELAASGDEIAAADIWARLFGECFPAPTAEERQEAQQRKLETLYGGGTLAVTGRPAPSTRAWRP
jgi:predicted nucleotidyltransferase